MRCLRDPPPPCVSTALSKCDDPVFPSLLVRSFMSAAARHEVRVFSGTHTIVHMENETDTRTEFKLLLLQVWWET